MVRNGMLVTINH